jgi:hypothetical protein
MDSACRCLHCDGTRVRVISVVPGRKKWGIENCAFLVMASHVTEQATPPQARSIRACRRLQFLIVARLCELGPNKMLNYANHLYMDYPAVPATVMEAAFTPEPSHQSLHSSKVVAAEIGATHIPHTRCPSNIG